MLLHQWLTGQVTVSVYKLDLSSCPSCTRRMWGHTDVTSCVKKLEPPNCSPCIYLLLWAGFCDNYNLFSAQTVLLPAPTTQSQAKMKCSVKGCIQRRDRVIMANEDVILFIFSQPFCSRREKGERKWGLSQLGGGWGRKNKRKNSNPSAALLQLGREINENMWKKKEKGHDLSVHAARAEPTAIMQDKPPLYRRWHAFIRVSTH